MIYLVMPACTKAETFSSIPLIAGGGSEDYFILYDLFLLCFVTVAHLYCHSCKRPVRLKRAEVEQASAAKTKLELLKSNDLCPNST